jgi:PPOX class probable F420-dependent enzyme
VSARVGRLATVDAGGAPHVVPVCFVVVDDTIYSPIDQKPKSGDPRRLRRLRNIAGNPSVCLTVDHFDEDWSRLWWLQVRAEAGLEDDPTARDVAIAALRAKYPQYRTMDLETLPLIRLEPTALVGWTAG